MDSVLAKMIEIAFSNIKEQQIKQQEIIDRQNEIILKQENRIDSLERTIHQLINDDSDDSYSSYKG